MFEYIITKKNVNYDSEEKMLQKVCTHEDSNPRPFAQQMRTLDCATQHWVQQVSLYSQHTMTSALCHN